MGHTNQPGRLLKQLANRFGFESPQSESPPSKTVQPEPDPVEHEEPPDNILSHNLRIEAKNACFEPIYVDGKDTGQWPRCHGGQIAEVDGERLATYAARVVGTESEVNSIGEEVGCDDRVFGFSQP